MYPCTCTCVFMYMYVSFPVLMLYSTHDMRVVFPPTDCPQVQAIYDYKAVQPDELSLERGDVVKVFRKMADGKDKSRVHQL